MSEAHKMTDAAAIRTFITGGNATFTVQNTKTGVRFTYKVRQKGEGERKSPHFINLMNGPDNENDYAYIGFLRRDGTYVHGGAKAAAKVDAQSVRAFSYVWDLVNGRVTHKTEGRPVTLSEVPSIEFWHEGRCCRCGRKLTVPESISTGLGPECASKLGR